MPTLHNPTANDLTLYALETDVIGPVLVRAGSSVELTDEQAAALKDTVRDSPIFELHGVEDDEADDRDEADSDDARDAADAESSNAPKRETAKRGGKTAEVSSAPSRETR